MGDIFFSEYSIGRFPVMLLSLLVTGYFLFRKKRSSTTLWLVIAFLSFFMFNAGYFIAYSVYASWGAWGWYVASFGSFGPIGLIQFAYRFPDFHYRRESKVVLVVSILLYVLAVSDYLVLAHDSPIVETSTHFGALYASRFLPVFWIVCNIWMIALCLRQSWRLGKSHALQNGKRFRLWRFIIPETRSARAARNFALLVTLELTLSFTTALFMSLNRTSLSTFNIVSSAGMQIICVMYILVYLNNSAEPNSFMVKLSGISLLVMFLVVGGMSSLLVNNYDDMYTEKQLARVSAIRHMLHENMAGKYEDLAFVCILPNDSLADQGMIYSKNRSLRIDESLRLWRKPPSLRVIGNPDAPGDAIRDESGLLVRAGFYTRIGGRGYCVFPFESNGETYIAGFDFVSYRAYMHRKALWVLLIMVLVPLVSLIVYPFLFYTSLGVPLAGLLEGVRSVDRGDLAVRVPVMFKDEIGHISHMFNRMVDSLREKNRALDDYAANLERKVEDRTRELEKEREELTHKNNIIQNDLHLARKIQQGLVPVSSPLPCISFLYKPMEQVGGDFYDFIRFRDRNKIGIFICDVSGHGVHAAFITSMIKTAILQSGERKENPAELLTYINDLLYGQTAGNFITALHCICYIDEQRIVHANAGHPQPFIVTTDGIDLLPKGHSPALAIYTDTILKSHDKQYHNIETIMPVHSKLLMYTDGFTEVRKTGGNTYFEDECLEAVLCVNRGLAAGEFINALYRSVNDYRAGAPFEDDICIICLEC